MAKYWVVGGEYTDTSFRELARGEEQRFGPFDNYELAKKEWANRTWAAVDDAHARFRIIEEDGRAYWVVGGVYTDTSFTVMANGGTEERHGPFDEYEQAKKAWQEKAWSTVDDCNARFRIERL